MKTAKIGEKITLPKGTKLESFLTGDITDGENLIEGIVNSDGDVRITTGEFKGKILLGQGITVKGHDTENISEYLYSNLKNDYDFDETLKDAGIEENEFKKYLAETIQELL